MSEKYKDTRFLFSDSVKNMTVAHGVSDYRCVTLVDPYHAADPRILVRIVAWNKAPTTNGPLLVLICGRERNDMTMPEIDLAPHRAFIAGDMPAAVYADWLEEIGVEVPRPAADLLRGW